MLHTPLHEDVCFVCLEATPPLLRDVCECRHAAVHAACLQRVLDRVQSHTDGTCPVCRSEYACVQRRFVLATHECLVSLAGTLCGLGIMVVFAWLAVRTVVQDIFVRNDHVLALWSAYAFVALLGVAYACFCVQQLVECNGVCMRTRCTVV